MITPNNANITIKNMSLQSSRSSVLTNCHVNKVAMPTIGKISVTQNMVNSNERARRTITSPGVNINKPIKNHINSNLINKINVCLYIFQHKQNNKQ